MEAIQSWNAGDGALDAIEASLKEQGWKDITRAGESVEARFGSRLAFRLLGGYLAPGRKRFPLHLAVSSKGLDVTAKLRSDEGFYVARLSIMDRVFKEHADRLFGSLRAATGNVGPAR
ncbi:hypothetical protein ACGFNU_39720 [Spirillospora sp. NPDC048911]|uniref:hypothetical protein n=1 Tax=Spirillospora sp. NPDC048911 TaxID=3364527 RepID=UPI00371EC45B